MAYPGLREGRGRELDSDGSSYELQNFACLVGQRHGRRIRGFQCNARIHRLGPARDIDARERPFMTEPAPTPAAIGRKRFRLSLRVLMILVLLLGGGMGWYVYQARTQREAVKAIEAAGGKVYYDLDWECGEDGPTPRKPRWPKWLVDRLGTDYLGQVIEVQFFRSTSNQADDRVMARIGQLSGLQELEFGAHDTQNTGFLGECRVTDDGLVHLRGLCRLSRLRLTGTGIKGPGLVHLSGLKALKHLELMYDITDEGATFLPCLVLLEELSIMSGSLTDDGMVHLAPLTQLKRLHLQVANVTAVGLSRLKGWNRLTRLSLSAEDLEDYRFLGQFPELTTLELTLEKIVQEGPNFTRFADSWVVDLGLASLGTLAKLRELSVHVAPYPESLLAHIGRLQELERLTLTGGLKNIPTADFGYLSRLRGINSLRIEYSTLDDTALTHLAGLRRMKSLSLSGNPITDKGLSRLSGLTELETLELDHTLITDAGLIHLIALKKCKNVTVVNTRVTPNGFSALRAQQKAR
jgi:internalin A